MAASIKADAGWTNDMSPASSKIGKRGYLGILRASSRRDAGRRLHSAV